MLMLLATSTINAQKTASDCIYTKTNSFPVTLRVTDNTKQEITNPKGGYHDKNIYAWLDSELKVQNPRTPDNWWYPMYPDVTVEPTGTVNRNDNILNWSITLQVAPGNYEWNPGANSLGKHFINPGMFKWEGGNPRFSVASDGSISGTTEVTVSNTPYEGTPYHGTPFAIPGVIQLEDFDLGGEGVAYHDQEPGHPADSHCVYRVDEGVEIEDDGGNDGYHLGYTNPGEWMKYTMDVTKAGTYDIIYTTASVNSNNKFQLLIDDNLLGEYTVPVTSSWTAYVNTTIYGITLEKGIQVLTMAVTGGNLDKIEFKLVEEKTPYAGTPYHGTPFVIPGVIQLEDFDLGGEGVAYHDVEPGHPAADCSYRVDEGVEILDDGGNDGYHLGYTNPGEWMKYTMDVTKSGTYDFIYTTASENPNNKFQLLIDDNLLGEYPVPVTSSWTAYVNTTVHGITLKKGIQVLTMAVTGGNLDKIEFKLVEETGIESIQESGRIFVENKVLHLEGFQASASLNIYNLLGQKVVCYDRISGNTQINLRPQTYIVVINNNGNSIIRKILIK
jgi:hypothetical protein